MRRLAKLLLALGLGTALLLVVVMTWGEQPNDGSEVRAGLATGSGPTADVPNPNPSALRRCRDLGRAALEDTSCLALWAETRRRFLGGGDDALEVGPWPDDVSATEPRHGGRRVAPPDGATDADATSSISDR
ncbi:MAG: putative entry exclusion protein TrbK-alt [Pseudomonadota bacterium]